MKIGRRNRRTLKNICLAITVSSTNPLDFLAGKGQPGALLLKTADLFTFVCGVF
jgi:hypothetical protein